MTSWSDNFKKDPQHYTPPYGQDSEVTKILVVSKEVDKDLKKVDKTTGEIGIIGKIQWKVIGVDSFTNLKTSHEKG